MVKYKKNLDATFKALADPTRRAILENLARGQASVSQLAAPHRMSLPAVMKHLRVLESAGLLQHRKQGRSRHCRLSARPLQQAESWLSRYRVFWNRQFDSLERYLMQENDPQQKSQEKKPWPKRKLRPKPHSS
jgi:DNA-binding transcriptional ArsR family regulator